MKDIADFFSGLFETSLWPARWHCGQWSDFHGWLYILSDLCIWLSYFLIPVFIFKYLRRKREELQFSKIYFLFASFILLCGTTHFLDALMFWVPIYRFNALVKFITAVVSLATVYYLVQYLPDIFKQRTYNELLGEIERRKEAERKLAIANADLEKFAYVASHDLQEPLRKIIVFSEMLDQRNEEVFDVRSKELINKTIRSSNRMQRLITDVLSLSKLTQDVPLLKVDLNSAIDLALEDLEVKITDRQAEITVGKLPEVKGNKGYLQQLFYNLIGNAIKFATEKPIINITGSVENGKAIISIKDNGIGIDKEYFEKIFLPFQRLNSSAEYEGSGIGLSLCVKIVTIHGGEIAVESEVGKGSNFIVTLQLAGPDLAG
jgi:two-component system, chemotaxis family, sensor kinase Cph1